mmetsp:Transcript_19255/g.40327  ORF Transcript_19255/g.40327 Transcript_19255/m.40327 type:complete len:121 (+) Transcript_19255:154-516(+)
MNIVSTSTTQWQFLCLQYRSHNFSLPQSFPANYITYNTSPLIHQTPTQTSILRLKNNLIQRFATSPTASTSSPAPRPGKTRTERLNASFASVSTGIVPCRNHKEEDGIPKITKHPNQSKN